MSDWIEWNGGGREADPTGASTLVEVRFRCGADSMAPSDYFVWDHTHQGADIIAYRVVQS